MFRPGHSWARIQSLLRRVVKSERGSISILTFGLFGVVLVTALTLTNISAVYIAKRTLTLATEAAVQQGVKNLDMKAYYTGEYNLSRAAVSLFGLGEDNPGIPIDCSAGAEDAEMVIDGWSNRDIDSHSKNLHSIKILEISCDGFQMALSTSATVEIPIPLPFLNISKVKINSQAAAIPERAESNNYSGFDIG